MIVDLTVEIPRGSRNVYSVDPETGRVRLERLLLTDMVYPADCGYLDGTLSPNGEPVNALVLLEEPTFPGVSVTVRPVGVCRLSRAHGDDVKIITVPAQDPRWSATREITDVAAHTLHAVQHFYQHVTDLTGVTGVTDLTDLSSDEAVSVGGFGSRTEAERLVMAALHAFRSHDTYES